MLLNQFLILAAAIFSLGIYGLLVRRNIVLILLSVELMLAAVNINLIAFEAVLAPDAIGQVFTVFVITVAAAEVGNRAGHRPDDLPQSEVCKCRRAQSDAVVEMAVFDCRPTCPSATLMSRGGPPLRVTTPQANRRRSAGASASSEADRDCDRDRG